MAKLPATSGLQLAKLFIVTALVNGLVIYLANILAPQAVVLGSARASYSWALIHSAKGLAIIGMLAVPAMEYWQAKRNKVLTMNEWMLAYLVINTGGLWWISRYADDLGLGISSWTVALVLGAVLDFAQGMSMSLVYPKKK